MRTDKHQSLQKQTKQLLGNCLLIFLLLQTFSACAATAADQKAATNDKGESPCVVIVHVDVMPPFSESGLKLLQDYRNASKDDQGEKRVEILQQAGRPNHFTMIEEWLDQDAYEKHLSAKHTRDFRSALQPMLGSPFDERIHHPAS